MNVRDRVFDHAANATLAQAAGDGGLALGVAATFLAEDAAAAYALHDRGGLRGRVVLQF